MLHANKGVAFENHRCNHDGATATTSWIGQCRGKGKKGRARDVRVSALSGSVGAGRFRESLLSGGCLVRHVFIGEDDPFAAAVGEGVPAPVDEDAGFFFGAAQQTQVDAEPGEPGDWPVSVTRRVVRRLRRRGRSWAITPLSKYSKGFAGSPAMSRAIVLPT